MHSSIQLQMRKYIWSSNFFYLRHPSEWANNISHVNHHWILVSSYFTLECGEYSDRCVLICILSTSTFWPFGQIWNWIEQIENNVLMSINDPYGKLCNSHLLNGSSQISSLNWLELNGDAPAGRGDLALAWPSNIRPAPRLCICICVFVCLWPCTCLSFNIRCSSSHQLKQGWDSEN